MGATITSFTENANGSYTLTGTQLNGRDEGAAYGDDEQMAENYPLVQLVDLFNGEVFYATTSNWSSTGVAIGSTPETVNVVLPPGIGGNNGMAVPFLVFAIADGIPSVPIARSFAGPGFPGPIGPNEALPQLAGASQLSAVGGLPSPGTDDTSPPTLVAATTSLATVAPAIMSGTNVDAGFKNSTPTPATGSPAPPHAVQFHASLGDAEVLQWAGLNAALDVLSA